MVLYPNKLPESERVCSGICTMTKVCGGWLGVIFFGGGGLFICVTTFYNSIRHIPYLILK